MVLFIILTIYGNLELSIVIVVIGVYSAPCVTMSAVLFYPLHEEGSGAKSIAARSNN